MSADDGAHGFGTLWVLSCLMAVMLAGCNVIVDTVDRLVNRVDPARLGETASPADAAFHHKLFVADLHADTLLWDRDILLRSYFGHVDVPRLHDGNVSLQVFSVYTKSGLPLPHCVIDGPNLVTALNAVELRPLDTWFDLEARALYQAERLHRFEMQSEAEESAGGVRLRILRTAGDLMALTTAWRHSQPEIGAVLSLEAASWLGDVATPEEAAAGVQRLFDAGFRQIALTHRFDNGLAGSSEGCSRPGLSPHGIAVIEEAQRLGMVVDVAHLSSPAFRKAVSLATAPVVVSHTGAQGACQAPCYPPRNLTDEEIQAVARTGGVIGIGYWPAAVGNDGLESVAKTIAYVASVLSQPQFVARLRGSDSGYDPFDHIALGSDFDGFVTTPIDTSQLALLTAALRGHDSAAGITFTDREVRKIAGGNVCRVFAERLPGGSVSAPATICHGMI